MSVSPSTITSEKELIESLDVHRGFALLGISLLNILGFGLASAFFMEPATYVKTEWGVDFVVWVLVELTSEGVMRTLFSMLFGAGVGQEQRPPACIEGLGCLGGE